MKKGKEITATVLFVFISLFFHLILGLIIANSKVSFIARQPPIKIIKARLMVARLPKITPEKRPVIDIDLKPSVLKEDSGRNSIAVPKTSLLSEDLVESVDSKEPSAKVVQKDAITSTSSADQIYAASKRIINHQNQQIIEQYTVEELSPTYSIKVSLSAMVAPPLQHRYIAPLMTVEKRRKVMIYCDSTAKKITAMISGLLKGSIECEKLPELQSFIDKRRGEVTKRK